MFYVMRFGMGYLKGLLLGGVILMVVHEGLKMAVPFSEQTVLFSVGLMPLAFGLDSIVEGLWPSHRHRGEEEKG